MVIVSTQNVAYFGSKTKEALRRGRKCEQLERLTVGILSSKTWLTARGTGVGLSEGHGVQDGGKGV